MDQKTFVINAIRSTDEDLQTIDADCKRFKESICTFLGIHEDCVKDTRMAKSYRVSIKMDQAVELDIDLFVDHLNRLFPGRVKRKIENQVLNAFLTFRITNYSTKAFNWFLVFFFSVMIVLFLYSKLDFVLFSDTWTGIQPIIKSLLKMDSAKNMEM